VLGGDLQARPAPDSLQESDAEVPARRAPSRRQPSSMEAIAERAVAAVQNELPDRVQLELKVEPPIPTLLCDAFQVEQLLLQLLRNGVEASEEAVRGLRPDFAALRRIPSEGFITTAHGSTEVEETLNAARRALKKVG